MGKQEYEYYAGAKRFADELAGRNQPDASTAALKLLGNVLTKRPGPLEGRGADFDVGAVDLLAMRALTSFLLMHDDVSPEERRAKVSTSARVLGRVRAESQFDYVPKQVFANVAPPPGEGLRIAGMSPEAITDPAAREEYKASIRANQLNNLINKRQQALHGMEAELAKPIVEYMSRVAAADAAATSVVRQAIIDARLTDLEKAQVIRSKTP